jgi:hypothetical protein
MNSNPLKRVSMYCHGKPSAHQQQAAQAVYSLTHKCMQKHAAAPHLSQMVVKPVIMCSKALQPHQLPPAAAALYRAAVLLQAADYTTAARLHIRAELCSICCAAFVQR